MIDLSAYIKRYEFSGTPEEAVYFTGDHAEFEADSQKRFMLARGLEPHHRFLDLGCGCLRGTIHLVDYLDEGNFHGADISKGLLDSAIERVKQNGLKNRPHLSLLRDYDLFAIFKKKFDFVLSVSLLTHLLPTSIPDLFRGVAKVLGGSGTWFFTIYPTKDGSDHDGDIELSFYGKEFLRRIGLDCGLVVEDIPGDFPNPSPSPFHYIDRVNTNLGQWAMKARVA